MKKAVLTISIGDRPFFKYTSKSIKDYANKIGADYHEILEYEVPEIYKDIKIGRPEVENNMAYLIKILVIHDFLIKHGYDRIIFLDDTCIINTDCPDLFNIVPTNFIGANNEGVLEWPLASSSTVKMFEDDPNIHKNILVRHDYFNTGVLVFSKEHANLVSENYILILKRFFNNGLPEQTYLNFLVQATETPMFYLPHIFNRMNVHKERANERVNYANYTVEQRREQYWTYNDFDFLTEEMIKPGKANHAFIWHITSFWKPEPRYKLLKRLYELSR